MASAVSTCPECGEHGRWGFDDDWCHEDLAAAIACPREGATTDTADCRKRQEET